MARGLRVGIATARGRLRQTDRTNRIIGLVGCRRSEVGLNARYRSRDCCRRSEVGGGFSGCVRPPPAVGATDRGGQPLAPTPTAVHWPMHLRLPISDPDPDSDLRHPIRRRTIGGSDGPDCPDVGSRITCRRSESRLLSEVRGRKWLSRAREAPLKLGGPRTSDFRFPTRIRIPTSGIQSDIGRSDGPEGPTIRSPISRGTPGVLARMSCSTFSGPLFARPA